MNPGGMALRAIGGPRNNNNNDDTTFPTTSLDGTVFNRSPPQDNSAAGRGSGRQWLWRSTTCLFKAFILSTCKKLLIHITRLPRHGRTGG